MTQPTDAYTAAEAYCRSLSAADFADLNVSPARSAEKTSTGSAFSAQPPVDYTAVEIHADILSAFDRGDRSEALYLWRLLQTIIGVMPDATRN